MSTITYSFGPGRPPVTGSERAMQANACSIFNDGMFAIAQAASLDQSAVDKARDSKDVYVPAGTNPKTKEINSGITGNVTFSGRTPTTEWGEAMYTGGKLKHHLHDLEARLAPADDKPSFAQDELNQKDFTALTANITKSDGVHPSEDVNYQYSVSNGVQTMTVKDNGGTSTIVFTPIPNSNEQSLEYTIAR